MTLPKFLLSGISTITILLIGWPLATMYPTLRQEKATGISVFFFGLAEAIFTIRFWLSAILLLVFFWYTCRLGSKILRVVLFWIPTISATVVGGGIIAALRYVYTRGH